jgi:hypothetical protein
MADTREVIKTAASEETKVSWAVMESLAIKGDLSGLNPQQKVLYYNTLCERLSLDPLTQPFNLLKVQGKEILYANRSCTDQLAMTKNITRSIISREKVQDVYVVTCRATMPGGRSEEAVGAVSIQGLKGDVLANAIMKAETKAKRRVTLSICGLGMTDESEIDTIPGAEPIDMTNVTPVMSEDTNSVGLKEAIDGAFPSEPKAPVYEGELLDESTTTPPDGDRPATDMERREAFIHGLRTLELDAQLLQDCFEMVTGRRETKGATKRELDAWIAKMDEAAEAITATVVK